MAKNKGGVYVYQQMEKTLAEWLAETKPIPARVLCWESDTGIIRMGDGKSMYKELTPRLSSGLSPRINEVTENWEVFNISTKEWDDTGIRAYPPSAPRISQVTGCWEVWNDTERKYEDTGIKPVLASNLDGGKPGTVYTADQIFNFGKITE